MKNLSVKIAGIFAVAAFALTAVSADAAFTRDLTLGSTGADVIELQTWLEAKGYLVIPAGTSKGYFGALTQSALAKYQAAAGISPAAGYFGPITRAKVAAEGTTPDNDNDDDDNSSDDLSGGEASLEGFELNSGDDSEIEENDSAAIAEIEFDVEDADIEIDRIDLRLVADGANDASTDEDPWDVFSTIVLSVDGDEIAEMDIDDEDNYLDEDDGTIRLADIGYKVEEGETVTIAVELTAQNSVDGVDTTPTWTINVEEDGIRATDAEGIQQYIGDDSDTVDFDIDEEGAGEELNVRSSSDDFDATSLKVEDDTRSDLHGVFAFDLESEESDIELDSVEIGLEVGSTTVDMVNVISDLVLEIDGEEFDDWSFVSGTSSNVAVVSFDIDGDYTIDADSEVAVVLFAEFKAANNTNYASGMTFEASIADEAIEAEGSNDVLSDGAATGEEHTLLIGGLTVEDAPVTDSDSEDGIGTFTFEIELTAFEEDVLIEADSAARADNNGFDWTVVGGTATSSITVQSDADLVSGDYVIEEGRTETFTITITVDPAAAGSYYVVLDDVTYEVDSREVTQSLTPQSDYDTRAVSISN